jgi:F-type H+-transporting ATPase subunit gamma
MAARALSAALPLSAAFRSASVGCFANQAGATRGYPANLKAVKRRRATVRTVGKITKTMKTVASSKMPIAQAKAASISPFFLTLNKALEAIGKKPEADKDVKVLTLAVCTDKGLCGSTNNNMTRSLIKEDLSANTIIIWGDKGCGAFENSIYKRNVKWSAHPDPKGNLSFIEVSTVVEQLLKEEFDILRIVHNKLAKGGAPFIDSLYVPSYKKLVTTESKTALMKYELEAVAGDELLSSLNEFHIASAINYAAYQNQAVEVFNRRNAMDNASKNAKEVSAKLTILYNRVRQGAITTELCEITAGAAAVDQMDKKK